MKVSPRWRQIVTYGVSVVAATLVLFGVYRSNASYTELAKVKATAFTEIAVVKATLTAVMATLAAPTGTPIPSTVTSTPTPLAAATSTKPAGVVTPTSAATPVPGQPYPDAPLCPDSGSSHDNSLFHTEWDAARGCHYDHEHGMNPFVPEVNARFPNFDLRALLGGVGIGHTNPSGPAENTRKHGGFKWTVRLNMPCVPGFEAATNCVTDAVIQFHGFGDARLENEVTDGARIHSAAAMIRMGPENDPGWVYTVQHVEYGEICAAYQGEVVPYPLNFFPNWDCAFGQYWTTPCIGLDFSNCFADLAEVLAGNRDLDIIATTKKTGTGSEVPGNRPPGSSLLAVLWRNRDAYQVFDSSDLTWPFTYLYACSTDGGLTFAALPGCRYNSTTSMAHEVAGTVPESWDNLEGFDTNPAVGRITADGFTTRFGAVNMGCAAAGPDCHPFKAFNAYVGTYGGNLCPTGDKCSNTGPDTNPERELYFCGPVVCAEGAPGARSSGWIGPNN